TPDRISTFADPFRRASTPARWGHDSAWSGHEYSRLNALSGALPSTTEESAVDGPPVDRVRATLRWPLLCSRSARLGDQTLEGQEPSWSSDRPRLTLPVS